jgi:hypothetical protein
MQLIVNRSLALQARMNIEQLQHHTKESIPFYLAFVPNSSFSSRTSYLRLTRVDILKIQFANQFSPFYRDEDQGPHEQEDFQKEVFY